MENRLDAVKRVLITKRIAGFPGVIQYVDAFVVEDIEGDCANGFISKGNIILITKYFEGHQLSF